MKTANKLNQAAAQLNLEKPLSVFVQINTSAEAGTCLGFRRVNPSVTDSNFQSLFEPKFNYYTRIHI